MFKTAVSLEEAGKVSIVALDKTGTITSGEPKVTDIIPAEGISEDELVSVAYALEQRSEHPLRALSMSTPRRILQTEKAGWSRTSRYRISGHFRETG